MINDDPEIDRLNAESEATLERLRQSAKDRKLAEVKNWQDTFSAGDGLTGTGNSVQGDAPSGGDDKAADNGTLVLRCLIGGAIQPVRFTATRL